MHRPKEVAASGLFLKSAEVERMRKPWILVTCCVAVAGSVVISGMANAKIAPGSFNVTITVYDTDASGVATNIASDDYNGQGFATYNYLQDPNTTTNIWSGTNLFLDLYNQSTRTLYINANDPLPGSFAGSAPGKYWQNVEFYTGCYDVNRALILFQTITTSNGNCRVGVDFTSGGVKYKFDMGPVQPAPGPATGWAYVQCDAISAGKCTKWTVTPNLNSPNPKVANLYYYSTKPAKLSFLHQYYDTYRIDVTNP